MPSKVKLLNTALDKKGISNVRCSEWHNSIKLEGELNSWDEIYKAGKIAAKFGYKGVVNKIKLRGFTEPEIKAPDINDDAIEGREPDVVVIGGGVIGCSIARQLAKYDLDILVLEKESDVAMHQSSRNDGMIHPGIASHCNTLRGKYNVKGNAMYDQVCKELGIPFERWGNFVMFNSMPLAAAAGAVFKVRSKHYGIPMEYVNKERLKELEPNVTDEAVAAYSFPTVGFLSPYKLTVALAENAVENGVVFSLNTVVKSMEKQGNRIAKVITNRGTVYPKTVINAAGVFSDKVADMADDQFFTIHPRKGQIVILDKKKGPDVNRALSIVKPDIITATSKGGGVMRTIDSNVLVGPDATEQPYREDYSTDRENISAVMDKHLKLIKDFKPSDAITYFSGIRACTYEEEFIIERSEYVDNLIHAAGIQSPGLASAPAIAEEITRLTVQALSEQMRVVPNDKYNPKRRQVPHLGELNFEEKQKVIKENPDYGVIVCRCEEISRGEIVDAIHGPLPAVSVDAIKRRVRPGMGRCQGGFCAPLVTKIICEETGMTPDEVTKSGDGSHLLFEKTQKGGSSK